MMALIDGYILRRFVVSYFGCLASLVLLFIVLDVFTKIDEFTAESEASAPANAAAPHKASASTPAGNAVPNAPAPSLRIVKPKVGPLGFARNVGLYYLYRLPVIFDLINGLIVLMAATFTLGWLEKQNELLPLLAAGVRLRRIFLPAWALALAFIFLGVLNREMLIPANAREIMKKAEDPQGKKPTLIQGGFDEHGVHIDGAAAYADRKLVMQGRLTVPSSGRRVLVHLACDEMYWQPASATEPSGWRLHGLNPMPPTDLTPHLKQTGPDRAFLDSDLSFDRLTRRPNFFLYLSAAELMRLVEHEDQCPRRTDVIATLHGRATRPLTEFLIVLIGVPLLVGCPQRNLYIKAASILGLFMFAQLFDYACMALARAEYVEPALAAWLPVLLFGPWSLVASDATVT